MFSIFSRNRGPLRPLLTDLHSHLIPGIDDGVRTPEESFAVIDHLISLGYKRIITTPHIMPDLFANTTQSVAEAHRLFLPVLRERGYSLPFECAAEYYFEETLFTQVAAKEKLLTFGEKYFLFETNMISEPLQLKEFIFNLTSQAYRPVLAHPERYQYMSIEKAEDMRDRGVLLQINMLSLSGFYGPLIRKMASRLVDKGLVDMLGSDCHNIIQARLLREVQESRLYKKALELPLLNYTL